jgi:hypothetical protein
LLRKKGDKMAYKVFGIKDSQKEGWYQRNKDHPECCTTRTEVETPLGIIVAEVSGDSDYPGVWLSFRANGDTYERTIALLEAESPESVALKVWTDERIREDWTHRFPVENKNDEKET